MIAYSSELPQSESNFFRQTPLSLFLVTLRLRTRRFLHHRATTPSQLYCSHGPLIFATTRSCSNRGMVTGFLSKLSTRRWESDHMDSMKW